MKLWLYLAMLWLLFFSQTYAVDTSFYPNIEDANNLDSDNNVMDSLIQRRILNSIVDVTVTSIHFKEDERIDKLVKYAYNKCIEVIGNTNWYYSCINMILTFDSENGAWQKNRVSATNDRWLCMLHYRRHKDFIDSEAFQSDEAQLDYCIGVRQNSMQRGKMPRTAYKIRNKNRYRFAIQ